MKAWKPVQNLIFDLDDTLYQRRDPYLAAFHACFGQIQGLDEDAPKVRDSGDHRGGHPL